MDSLVVPIASEEIETHLRGFEIPQRAYTNGLLKAQAPARHVSYLPGGFTVGTVLDRKSGNNLIQISDAEDPLPTLDGQRWPERTRFYFQFCNAAYNTPVTLPQQRVRRTRGGFAVLVAEEIQKMLVKLPQFPFDLDQIKVLSIDVCSRGTLQARIFVDPFALAPHEVEHLAEMLRG